MYISKGPNEFDPDHQPGETTYSAQEGCACTVTHVDGSTKVLIDSGLTDWGTIPITGEDDLRMIRDAFTAICKERGIE